MTAGIRRYAEALTATRAAQRRQEWSAALIDPEAQATLHRRREQLRRILGAADERLPASLDVICVGRPGQPLASVGKIRIHAVRWHVLPGFSAEGLLLEPAETTVAGAVLLPDCSQEPEDLCGLRSPSDSVPLALHLAKAGCLVLIPALLNRADTWSGNPAIRLTNQPHREFVYRAAYELGRHVIGIELQEVFAALDWLQSRTSGPLAVLGYGEGGLLAHYAAALDPRIGVGAVSGWFGPREDLWQQPIYRNVFGLLRDFGDAEVTALIAPRSLILEASRHPELSGPPAPHEGRSGAAPGCLATPAFAAVHDEWEAACRLWQLAAPDEPSPTLVGDGSCAPWSRACRQAIGDALGLAPFRLLGAAPAANSAVNPTERQKRIFDSMVSLTQDWLQQAEFRRAQFWAPTEPPAADTWNGLRADYRARLWEDVIGKLPPADRPMNPRTRLLYDTDRVTGYEVYLDLWQDVFAYGVLLLPRDLRPGERRPVVVCQHGLEGTPRDVIEATDSVQAYRQYAMRLAERGFIVYAPQNPYKGQDQFRVLQRRLNPLGYSLFSVIVRQHELTLNWLASLPCVEAQSIAFYGISYGGKTAMRVPAILDGYCLSICSADYNEWIWKNASARHRYSYLFTGEYEMFEFDLGNTFNYAEMARLIFPRPFMVERGHHDGVAPDEWVAYEYAKAFRWYDLMGRGDRIEMEVFDGPHAINGKRTFDFLHRHLNWPRPAGTE